MTTRQIIPSFFTASKLGFLRKTRTPVGKILKMLILGHFPSLLLGG